MDVTLSYKLQHGLTMKLTQFLNQRTLISPEWNNAVKEIIKKKRHCLSNIFLYRNSFFFFFETTRKDIGNILVERKILLLGRENVQFEFYLSSYIIAYIAKAPRTLSHSSFLNSMGILKPSCASCTRVPSLYTISKLET